MPNACLCKLAGTPLEEETSSSAPRCTAISNGCQAKSIASKAPFQNIPGGDLGEAASLRLCPNWTCNEATASAAAVARGRNRRRPRAAAAAAARPRAPCPPPTRAIWHARARERPDALTGRDRTPLDLLLDPLEGRLTGPRSSGHHPRFNPAEILIELFWFERSVLMRSNAPQHAHAQPRGERAPAPAGPNALR